MNNRVKKVNILFAVAFSIFSFLTFVNAQTVFYATGSASISPVVQVMPAIMTCNTPNTTLTGCSPDSLPPKPIPPIITPTTFCSTKNFSCAPELKFGTTSKKYIVPKPGIRIAPTDANYSVFPEHLNFTVKDRNILVVSRYWQTGCLYDANGNLMRAGTTSSRYICMQTATGKKDLPTELGLYNIQTKQNKDYKSSKYTTTGEEITATSSSSTIATAAPMPWAMHFGRIIGKLPQNKLLYDFSDGSALHEKQTINKYGSIGFVSHGCIAIEKGKGQFLQSVMTYGDLILVVSQNMPNSLDEAISLDK